MSSEVAPKTVDFVKQWVYGLFTKRQYQNWYIVKTKDSEFLLTMTDKRELYAIKDIKSGHIYIWDSALEADAHGAVLSSGMDNPFNVLIRDRFEFPHGFTRLWDASFGYLEDIADQIKKTGSETDVRSIMSKFRVCDRITLVTNVGPLHISLIALGERRFYTAPRLSRTGMPVPLTDWASFKYEANFKYPHAYFPYTLTEIFRREGIEKVSDIRGHYLEAAGDMLPKSIANEASWIEVPTKAHDIDELAGSDFLKAKTQRPNPYHYHINPSVADFSALSRRHQTITENSEHLADCLKLDGDTSDGFTASNWKDHLHKLLPADLAERYVAYFTADDAWLEQHRDVARAGYLEHLLRLTGTPVSGWLLVRPAEDSRFGPFDIYMRPDHKPFKRLIPAPMYYNKIFDSKLGGHK